MTAETETLASNAHGHAEEVKRIGNKVEIIEMQALEERQVLKEMDGRTAEV